MSPQKTYILKLYVAGNTPNSMRALKTLRNILETEFKGVYALKVIDVLKNPQLAEEDKILATPTLSKILPPPVRRIIGDLSDRERVLIGLDLLYEELSENDLANGNTFSKEVFSIGSIEGSESVRISAQVESELIQLGPDEINDYLPEFDPETFCK